MPRTQPPKSRPRPPTKPPRERKERALAPTFHLKEWRIHAGLSFRDMQDITGIDPALLKRAEDRASGKDVKNRTKGVDIGLLYAYAEALGLATIDPLTRKPDDKPSDLEQFAAAPPEWREDIVRMISRLPKQQ